MLSQRCIRSVIQQLNKPCNILLPSTATSTLKIHQLPSISSSSSSSCYHTSSRIHQQAASPEAKKDPPKGHIRVSVDGTEIDIPNGYTVLQACEVVGITIPRFCYHDRLSVAGNCRMCLVEVEKSPKPVASCAMPAMPNMKIKTNTPVVHKAREGVMEFLLMNHPLDCPICDQGGECDLQDESMEFGSDRSRFREVKRTVEDKNLGPLVKTVMTRCIHCTRCIRWSSEIAGVPVLGATGRGNIMEIGTYVTKPLDSEMSGNVIDLCPVGALTSKPYAFTARPWELTKTESIDVLDAVGSNIRVDTRGPEVMRILPRLNEDVNEEWIDDKTRFSYDGLKRQRLDVPLIKDKSTGEFRASTWPEALTAIRQAINPLCGQDLLAVAGDLADAESIIALKDLFNRLGAPRTIHTQYKTQINPDIRANYLFNSTISGLDGSDFVLLIGSNPRMEAAVLNTRIRGNVRKNNLPVYSIGPEFDPAYRHTHVGNNTSILNDIVSGKHELAKRLKGSKKPMIIVGTGALQSHELASSVYSALSALKKQYPQLLHTDDYGNLWNGINILHTQASRVAALDLGFVPGKNAHLIKNKAKFAYLLAAEEWPEDQVDSTAFIVYAGSHGDKGATAADVILPAASYVEKSGTYVNTEGRVQRTVPCVGRLANARDDWQIVRALAEVMGVPLPYHTIEQIRARLVDVAPHFKYIDTVESPSYLDGSFNEKLADKLSAKSQPFSPFIDNFYFTNAISRNSRIMAQASAAFPRSRNSYTAQRHTTPIEHMLPEEQSAKPPKEQKQ